jgi:hypothetical protein
MWLCHERPTVIDRSLLCHEAREKFLKKHKNLAFNTNVLIKVLQPNGVVHGACVQINQLGWNKIDAGPHAGLLWWPEELM